MSIVYMTTTEDEKVEFYTDADMRELFKKERIVQNEENYLLWLRVKTDKGFSYEPKYTIINTDDVYTKDYCVDMGRVLHAMRNNVDEMFREEDDPSNDRAYNAYWTVSFTDGNGKRSSIRIDWGAVEFENIEATLCNLILEA